MKRRYEVRSASGTPWWKAVTEEDAIAVLRSHGGPSDYVYDTVTGGRPSAGPPSEAVYVPAE